MNVGELVIKLKVNDRGAITAIDGTGNKLTQLEGKSGKASKSISSDFNKIRVGVIAAAAAMAGIFHGLNSAVNAASDFEEENSKLMTVFKDVQGATDAMRKRLVDNYNMSTTAATRLLASTGDLLTGLGIQQDKALDLSNTTQELAADLASFTNAQGGAKAVSDALTKAMLGERESLKTYGIAIGEADVKQQLLKDGKANLTGLALRQAKAEATLTLAMLQSKNAIGDVARTSDSYANIKRKVAAQVEDLSIKIGKFLLPAFKKVLERVEDIFKAFGQMGTNLKISWENWKFWAKSVLLEVEKVSGSIKATFTGIGVAIAAISTKNLSLLSSSLDIMESERVKNEQETQMKIWQLAIDHAAKINEIRSSAIEEEKNDLINLEQHKNNIDALEKEREIKRVATSGDAERMITKQKKNQLIKQKFDINKANKARIASEKERIRAEVALEAARVNAVSDLGNQLMDAAQGQSRALFNIGKGVSIASAIVDTIAAAVKSFHRLGGWPWGLVGITASLAAGYAQVARIRATEYRVPKKSGEQKIQVRGFEKGGTVEKGDTGYFEGKETEIIAPKNNFLEVVNRMLSQKEIDIAGGTLGNNYDIHSLFVSLNSKVDTLNETVEALELKTEFTAEEMSIFVERGNNYLLKSRAKAT